MLIEKYWKFLDRLPIWNNYVATFYVKDEEAAKKLNLEIKEFYIDGSYTFENKSDKEICFEKGGVIRIITTDCMIPNLHSNLIFMDSRIREDYIRETIQPIICKYDLNKKQSVLNPKLIYIEF